MERKYPHDTCFTQKSVLKIARYLLPLGKKLKLTPCGGAPSVKCPLAVDVRSILELTVLKKGDYFAVSLVSPCSTEAFIETLCWMCGCWMVQLFHRTEN